MDEREKIIEILKQTSDLWKEEESHGYIVSVDLGKIADTLIEARIRDITERGWIFMNGEAIVPTPNIYNKVAELLDCPKISQEESND